MVSARVCERASVFSSCRYICTTSVSTCLLSSVCFKWHMCIVKRHTYLREADKQPNTNTGGFFGFFGVFWVFFLGGGGIPRSVDCSDFEHNARKLTLKGTLHEDD